MKPSLAIIALIATTAVTTEATDPAALIKLKHIGNFVLKAATSAIQAKQNLVKSSTSAIINAKTNLIPHLVHFKKNQINSALELKKNLIKSKAPLIGQLGGGHAIQTAGQDIVPYSPPAAPPGPIEEPQTSYSPLPPLQPLPMAAPPGTSYSPLPPPQPLQTAAPPDQVPLGPYPPPSFAERQTNNVELAHAQPSFRPQQTLSHDSRDIKPQYSDFPTPPPPPPQYVMYV